MNPLSWCVVLREAGRDATVPPPDGDEPKNFAPLDSIPPFVDTAMTEGIYSPGGGASTRIDASWIAGTTAWRRASRRRF